MRKMFSKEQIKKMIDEAIQQNSTKLYLHRVNIDNDNFILYFVDSNKQPLDYENIDRLAHALSLYSSSDFQCMYDYDSDNIYTFSSGEFSLSYTISEESSFDDEVTPL